MNKLNFESFKFFINLLKCLFVCVFVSKKIII